MRSSVAQTHVLCSLHCGSRSRCFFGVGPEAFRLRQYADAEYAGDRPGFRSTYGAFLSLSRPHICVSLSAEAVCLTCGAHSTPEAEMVSVSSAIRLMGLPCLELWEADSGADRSH